jgi:hypothetical protein
MDIGIAAVLAAGGFVMTPLPAGVIAATLGASIAFALILGLLKIPVFAGLGIV